MRILVFLHGTVLMHASAAGKNRRERVNQVRTGESSVKDFSRYLPIGNAPAKLGSWSKQGAEISYLSPHLTFDRVRMDQEVLKRCGFPRGAVLFRQGHVTYAQVAESHVPDILIEDDCESIGGSSQMTFPNMADSAKRTLRHIVVKEFGGIDHLPDQLEELIRW